MPEGPSTIALAQEMSEVHNTTAHSSVDNSSKVAPENVNTRPKKDMYY